MGCIKFLSPKPKHGDGTPKFSAQVLLGTHFYLAGNLYAPDCSWQGVVIYNLLLLFSVLDWYQLFLIPLGYVLCIMRIFHFFNTSRVWVFEEFFVFVYDYFHSKNLQCRYNYACIRRVLGLVSTKIKILYLGISTKHQCMTSITILRADLSWNFH